ncbi:hypothetical protein LSTR_LSTR002772 [Laodelphax striatellus]|uniref:Cyclic nucleotide-binding domain-containing protein n=1 Tax=Laodelphax striatellus TaxID=195883 RepID=A0A482WN14_LAOST|nr:hypothetical protein LSTR_LSTR002772 [Laodelphax striatellus]
MDKLYRSRKHRVVYPDVTLKKNPALLNWCPTNRRDNIKNKDFSLEAMQLNKYVIDKTDIESKDTSYYSVSTSTQCQQSETTSAANDVELSKRESDDQQQLVQRRLQIYAQAFAERAARMRHRLEFPPTPSTVSSDPEEGNSIYPSPLRKRDQIVRWFSQEWGSTISVCESVRARFRTFRTVCEPQSYFYVTWLTLVTFSYLYNCWVIPLRITFPYQTEDNVHTWLILDCSMDAIYFLDLMVVKPRIMYIDQGFWVHDPKLTRSNYMKKLQFKMDMFSLIPIDMLYVSLAEMNPLLRVPRLLKISTFWEFFNHFDNVLSSPYIVRVARTLTYMIYLVHLNACAYYAVSVKEGLGINKWVFNGEGNAYIRCFYFATKTATSIGKNPRPENELEYLFMTACWLMGVFVFALLIGQIRDIIANATRLQTEYRKRVDDAMDHMRRMNLPPKVIERVKTWFSFTWEQQHTLDESRILDSLPDKMKTDVAINVHFHTLNKVQLFKDCDEALLRDLVLKLRPVLYLPGDYICKKGEVGREMYIVKTGQVQVVSGEDGSEVLATLTEGSVFGEISLLSLSGDNRRTADVRSPGFSNLFVLSKSDLNEALVFYPHAQEILKRKAKQIMRQNEAREKTLSKPLRGKSGLDNARLFDRDIGIRNKSGSKRTRSSRFCRGSQSVRVKNKLNKRSNSFDLGRLRSHSQEDDESKTENTFQCAVTVHRERE